MEKFVYVFSIEARDKLIKDGFHLLKSDERKNVFVFANSQDKKFSLDGASCFLSNTLTF